jgi:extracellular factor (EF) 3-hydroxypalmitic acid methyl ester biosynthesis protein
MRSSQESFRILPEFKLTVADMQIFLQDLRRWLEQVELGVLSQPAGDRQEYERRIIRELQEPVGRALETLFEKFEECCQRIPAELQPAHCSYVKRQLHPLVLCAPFMYRTFRKPLGYAGDYEMVNMMVRDPIEGASVFAKVLNTFFLSTPPVAAHRNRIDYLIKMLAQEAMRARFSGRIAKVFNLGCGPAKEIQDFIADSELSNFAQFTLLDFNEETLAYTNRTVGDVIRKRSRATRVQLVKKGVAQVLKEALKPNSTLLSNDYDLVYCAGLFDYMPDYICRQLMSIFYGMLAPKGLLVATNVDKYNPSKNWMEYSVDWHLIYRDAKAMEALVPPSAAPDSFRVFSEHSGVNTIIEIRKPEHA